MSWLISCIGTSHCPCLVFPHRPDGEAPEGPSCDPLPRRRSAHGTCCAVSLISAETIVEGLIPPVESRHFEGLKQARAWCSAHGGPFPLAAPASCVLPRPVAGAWLPPGLPWLWPQPGAHVQGCPGNATLAIWGSTASWHTCQCGRSLQACRLCPVLSANCMWEENSFCGSTLPLAMSLRSPPRGSRPCRRLSVPISPSLAGNRASLVLIDHCLPRLRARWRAISPVGGDRLHRGCRGQPQRPWEVPADG